MFGRHYHAGSVVMNYMMFFMMNISQKDQGEPVSQRQGQGGYQHAHALCSSRAVFKRNETIKAASEKKILSKLGVFRLSIKLWSRCHFAPEDRVSHFERGVRAKWVRPSAHWCSASNALENNRWLSGAQHSYRQRVEFSSGSDRHEGESQRHDTAAVRTKEHYAVSFCFLWSSKYLLTFDSTHCKKNKLTAATPHSNKV